ncbi:cupredoxin domain-containing protein [Krasilnikovia sp. M28-CT-15]|uniref:cupredoxin domain-containing protein n=1 Tax=Krasilnikovia sp. M28-CT-15 TaxID=3373540 RepID=UPI00387633D5
MNIADVVVLLASAGVVGFLVWFFFGSRRAQAAESADGVQRVQVVVRGGYRPDVIRVRQGVPVEIVFDRQESGDCTSRVVFGDFAVSAALPAFARTTVRLNPARAVLVFHGPRLTRLLDRIVNQLHRRLDAETEESLARQMHFPVD